MWFLLLQISLLLILAAALGAAATFWWMKRPYEDVTESHEELRSQAERLKSLPQMPSRDDLKAGLEDIAAKLAGLKLPDLAPVNDRLGLLERAVRGISLPEPDLRPLGSKLGEVEEDLKAVASSVARLDNADLKPLEARLAALEDLVLSSKPPEVDLGPVHSELATLGLSLGEMKSGAESARKANAEAAMAKLSDLSAAIATLRPLQGMLADIEEAVVSIDRGPVDLQPLHARFAEIETSLGMLKTELDETQQRKIEPVQRGLAGVQEALQGLPGPDLDPVLDAVHAIDSRDDLAAVENRLTAIEYSLAALHHMIRARADGAHARTESTWQPRPSLASSLPGNGEPRAGAPARPQRDVDPINPVRRANDQANLLVEPAFGPPDDLEQINGVGPILSGLLNDTGIYYYWQIAEWTPEEAAWVDSQLMYFKGRIKRDDWVAHAQTLAALPTAAKRPAGSAGRA